MKTGYHYIFLAILVGVLSGCRHMEEKWVDLGDYSQLDPRTCFIPFSSENKDLTEETINDCYLPGGVTFGEAMDEETSNGSTRTSSFSAIGYTKELLSWLDNNSSISYCGTYESVDKDGEPIRLSGRIILPKDGNVSRIMVVNHFTIGSYRESPSKSFPIEGMFASRGLAVIVPDYLGFGVTSDKIHPYLNSYLTARNVVDMYFAALPFLEHLNIKPKNDDIFIYGYSQGGAVALAVQRYFELLHPDVKIRLVIAGGGPYDIPANYDKMIETDNTEYPCVIPMVIQGLADSNGLDIDYAEYFSPLMMQNLDEWINSKKYTVDEISAKAGSRKVSILLTEKAMNKVTDKMSELYLAMYENSMTNDFYPKAPIYMFHSMEDDVVPFVNATIMSYYLSAQGANAEYNFGEYGIHRKACIRFIMTVLQLLKDKGDIDHRF